MDIITYALAHKAKVALESPKDGVPGKVLISDGQGGTTWGEHINVLVVKASENSAFNSTADTITVTSIRDTKGKTWDKSNTHIGDTVYIEEQRLPDRWISKIEGSTIYLAKLETIQVPVVGVTVNDTSVVDTATGIANIVVDETLKAASENAIANKAVYVETQAIRTYATQAIADEFTRATTNENRIEGILNSEITRAKAAEEANTASINSEIANRKVADTTLQQNISAEETRALAAEKTNADAIDAEKTRATTAENTINQNLAQSVADLSQSDATLQTNIDNEKTRAEGAEATLQSNIDNEASLRSAADGLLQQNITAEKTRAEAAEKTNADAIAAEAIRAQAAEKVNADNIAAEVLRATTAEEVNATAIETEKTRAMTAEKSNSDAIEAEKERALAAEQVNTNAIASEAATARAAEQANAAAINSEKTRAENAEQANALAIETEATTARAAEQANANAITAEATTARAAEAALQTALDNEIGTRSEQYSELNNKISLLVDDGDLTTKLNSIKEIADALQGEDGVSGLIKSVSDNKTAITAEESRAIAAEKAISDTLATKQDNLTEEQIAKFEKDTTYTSDNTTIEIDATKNNQISVKADVFADKSHTHAIADINDLQATLDGKQANLTDAEKATFEKDTTYTFSNGKTTEDAVLYNVLRVKASDSEEPIDITINNVEKSETTTTITNGQTGETGVSYTADTLKAALDSKTEIKNADGAVITELQTDTVSNILGVVSVVEENNTNIVTSGGVYNAIKNLGKCLPEFPEDKTKSYSLKLIPENGELKLTWVADTTINDL